MSHDIILMDGAIGTSLWAKAGDNLPVWRYNMERPEIVAELHREYIEAGSQIIFTNTFGANAGAFKGSQYTVREAVSRGVRIAKDAARGTGVRVALDVGPLSVLLEPYGDLTEEEAQEIYEEQIGAGMDEQPELVVLETFMDVNMLEIAARVARQYSVPVFCMMTFEKIGKTMMGQSVEDILEVLEPVGVDAVGINCSLGPDLALPIVQEFHKKTELPLIFKPNAGKPVVNADGSMGTAFDAATFVADMLPASEFVRYMGGCCGSSPEYIRLLSEALRGKK